MCRGGRAGGCLQSLCAGTGCRSALQRVQAPQHQRAPHLHADEEAGGELRARRAGVEQRGRRVREPALGQQVVGLAGAVDVLLVDADGHAHQHVLWALHHLVVDAQQVGALQGLRPEGEGEGLRGRCWAWGDRPLGRPGWRVGWRARASAAGGSRAATAPAGGKLGPNNSTMAVATESRADGSPSPSRPSAPSELPGSQKALRGRAEGASTGSWAAAASRLTLKPK